jgi:hypothetical protein
VDEAPGGGTRVMLAVPLDSDVPDEAEPASTFDPEREVTT